MMREGAPKTIYREDYTEPDFLISHVELAFEIADGNTRVTSSLRIQRNGSHDRPLVLDGEGLGLIGVSVDGSELDENAFKYVGGKVTVNAVPDDFEFGAVVDIQPETNTSLEGLAPCTVPSVRQRDIERSLLVLIVRMFYRPTP